MFGTYYIRVLQGVYIPYSLLTTSTVRLDWTKVNPKFTTAYILVLFHDIVSGVEALHEQSGMLHTDLKLENLGCC